MGTNYKAALIPQRIRETIHGWGKTARRKRRLGMYDDSTTIRTDTSTVVSLEEFENEDRLLDLESPAQHTVRANEIEMQSRPSPVVTDHRSFPNETSSRVGTPLLRPSASVSLSSPVDVVRDGFFRSSSMPARRD